MRKQHRKGRLIIGPPAYPSSRRSGPPGSALSEFIARRVRSRHGVFREKKLGQ